MTHVRYRVVQFFKRHSGRVRRDSSTSQHLEARHFNEASFRHMPGTRCLWQSLEPNQVDFKPRFNDTSKLVSINSVNITYPNTSPRLPLHTLDLVKETRSETLPLVYHLRRLCPLHPSISTILQPHPLPSFASSITFVCSVHFVYHRRQPRSLPSFALFTIAALSTSLSSQSSLLILQVIFSSINLLHHIEVLQCYSIRSQNLGVCGRLTCCHRIRTLCYTLTIVRSINLLHHFLLL